MMSKENNESNFAFEKKIGIAEVASRDLAMVSYALQKLILCMQETNKFHDVICEFFRLDFRQPYFDEQDQFPIGSFIMHMKWGSKKEIQEKSKNKEKK